MAFEIDKRNCTHCTRLCEEGMEKIGVCYACAGIIVEASDLKGTMKQIVWAEAIRNDLNMIIKDMLNTFGKKGMGTGRIDEYFEKGSAAYWINKFKDSTLEEKRKILIEEIFCENSNRYVSYAYYAYIPYTYHKNENIS